MRWAVVAVMLLLLLVSPTEAKRKPRPTPTPTVTPAPSPGCPAGTVLLEAQAWWREAGLVIPSQVGEHMHISACWPRYGTIVRDSLHVDLKVLIHAGDPIHDFLSRLRVNWRTTSESVGSAVIDRTNDLAIPLDANGNGSRTFSLDIPLGSMGTGSRRIRFNPMAGPDANRMFAANDWWVCVNACDVATPRTVGKGWYAERGYQNTGLSSPLPTAPVSGTWSVQVNMNPGGDGRATVQHGAFIDPDFHNGSAGRVLRLASGTFSGTLHIDTTQLANGPHKLVLLASDGELAGLQVIPFEVSN